MKINKLNVISKTLPDFLLSGTVIMISVMNIKSVSTDFKKKTAKLCS